MGNFRIIKPIPVMVKEADTFVSRTLPKGAMVSAGEMPVDPNRYVIVNWDGKDVLIIARELRIRAERALEGES
jgi:hypothetical protein